MYSQCPECLTRFRVPAAALRAAHGTVRCGRCGIAFDALSRLSDTLQDDGPDAMSGGSSSPVGATGADGLSGTSAGMLLGTGAGGSVPEFHFSADDIEQVFIDARDWQSRFGATSSPGDRAGRLGDSSTAELVGFLQDGETADSDEPERDADDPPVWVHEPESVEDITLEGERIEIAAVEAFDELEEDFLEREIANELDEQHRAEIVSALEPPLDSDPTDHVEVSRDIPQAPVRDDDRGADETDSTPSIVAVVSNDAEPSPVASIVASTPPEPGPPSTPDTQVVAETTVANRPADDAPALRPMSARWRRPAVADEESFEIGDHDHRLADDLAAAAGERTSAWVWGIGALLLALLLTAQLAHHYRLQLARDPTVGPALREIYARLGRPLPANWNLAAFELRQRSANASAPSATGAVTVHASLKNGARFAQPLPLLRLELEDRFGGTVARRDFEPAEYLKDPARATRLLDAGAATELELAVAGATTEAVGYRLDVCLRDQTGAVRCAEPNGGASASSQAPQ